ncbi:MAG TPA: EpsI family protein [bacterium]|nr:EpsI family protein [bacterium]HPQ66195.1 EpsI family protein [bacterium]
MKKRGVIVVVETVAAVLILGLAATISNRRHEPGSYPVIDLEKIPLEISGWKGKRVSLGPDHPARVGGVAAVYISYLKGDRHLDLYVVEGAPGTFSLHPPEYCLIGGASDETARSRIGVPYGEGKEIEVNRFEAERMRRRSLVYYWYADGNGFTPDYLLPQVANLAKRLAGRERAFCLVRLSWDGDDGLDYAEESFRLFIREALPAIAPIFSGGGK